MIFGLSVAVKVDALCRFFGAELFFVPYDYTDLRFLLSADVRPLTLVRDSFDIF